MMNSPCGPRINTPVRVLWFRGFCDRHTAHRQPGTGTPTLVPVPMMIISVIGGSGWFIY
uniref:Uncharacterized protein n=1 Tax=uncultured bacterium A1Q1_fos_291 TaxID=1256570 RepID=L7VYA3_9BACT|nr:hypothetical protein [uncultured bacterium A1Q1_fos_291]